MSRLRLMLARGGFAGGRISLLLRGLAGWGEESDSVPLREVLELGSPFAGFTSMMRGSVCQLGQEREYCSVSPLRQMRLLSCVRSWRMEVSVSKTYNMPHVIR